VVHLPTSLRHTRTLLPTSLFDNRVECQPIKLAPMATHRRGTLALINSILSTTHISARTVLRVSRRFLHRVPNIVANYDSSIVDVVGGVSARASLRSARRVHWTAVERGSERDSTLRLPNTHSIIHNNPSAGVVVVAMRSAWRRPAHYTSHFPHL
jgi:hypothetical protein